MDFAAALQHVCLVAVLELLLLSLAQLVAALVPQLQPPMTGTMTSNVHTYRSPAEDYLRRFPAPDACEELIDNILGNVHLHGLRRPLSTVLKSGVAIRSPDKGNAPQGKQRRRHVAVAGDCGIDEVEQGGTRWNEV
jgi:hypothetical protein